MWVRSQVQPPPAIMQDDVQPLDGEMTLVVDYKLPLTPWAQLQLFHRIFSDYTRDTGIVPVQKRIAYRKKDEQVNFLRNIIVFYGQIRYLLKTTLSPAEFADFDADVFRTDRRDKELNDILQAAPVRFAVSMLPSQRRKMARELQSKDAAAGICWDDCLPDDAVECPETALESPTEYPETALDSPTFELGTVPSCAPHDTGDAQCPYP